MFIPVTEQELRVENPDNASFRTMVHILNQFSNNENNKKDNKTIKQQNSSIATNQKW
jgi:hypothetical protein